MDVPIRAVTCSHLPMHVHPEAGPSLLVFVLSWARFCETAAVALTHRGLRRKNESFKGAPAQGYSGFVTFGPSVNAFHALSKLGFAAEGGAC